MTTDATDVFAARARATGTNDNRRFSNPRELRAELLRRLKLAETLGTIPGKKAGVRYTVAARWSGHQLAARVTVYGLRDIVAAEYVRRLVRREAAHAVTRYTVQALAVREAVERVMQAINYDESRPQEDYTCVGFFQEVAFAEESDEARALVARFEAELAAERGGRA